MVSNLESQKNGSKQKTTKYKSLKKPLQAYVRAHTIHAFIARHFAIGAGHSIAAWHAATGDGPDASTLPDRAMAP